MRGIRKKDRQTEREKERKIRNSMSKTEAGQTIPIKSTRKELKRT